MSGHDPSRGGGVPTQRPPHSGKDGEIPFDRLVPRRRAQTQVPLGRLEATVLMRVDGRRTILEIAQEIGLGAVEVLRIVERLQSLVPDLELRETEVVELSVDELWEEYASRAEVQAAKKLPDGE